MRGAGDAVWGVAEGTLLWTPDGPRPVETIQAGETVIAFDPNGFARREVAVERMRGGEGPLVEVQVGGRLLALSPTHPVAAFDRAGGWAERAVSDFAPSAWLAVDRQVSLPARPVALPGGDAALSALLGEDALALADALYEREKYFAEMGKRSLRVQLFELSGLLVATGAGGEWDGLDDAGAIAYYRAAWQQTFGQSARPDADPGPRLRRWLGDGARRAAGRALPAWVWQVESQSRAAFLRGFFDAASAVSASRVAVDHPSVRLVVGLQALLATVGIEASARAAPPHYRLDIPNVRRFAEWVGSNVSHRTALLNQVYRREPRYPSDDSAILPLDRVRPALARIRATHGQPRRTADTVDDRDAATITTLRLLATAFHDEGLRDLVNQQLYLDPVHEPRAAPSGPLFQPTLPAPLRPIANGVAI